MFLFHTIWLARKRLLGTSDTASPVRNCVKFSAPKLCKRLSLDSHKKICGKSTELLCPDAQLTVQSLSTNLLEQSPLVSSTGFWCDTDAFIDGSRPHFGWAIIIVFSMSRLPKSFNWRFLLQLVKPTPLRPGPLPLGQSTILTVLDAREPPTTTTTPSQSSSLRNCREHGVSQWLVLLDFLASLTLEIADEVVHNPSSSEFFNEHPQVIKQILNTVRCFPVLYSCTRIKCTSFESLQKCTGPSIWGHSCIAHKETNPPLVLSEICSVERWNHFALSVTMRPWVIAGGVI